MPGLVVSGTHCICDARTYKYQTKLSNSSKLLYFRVLPYFKCTQQLFKFSIMLLAITNAPHFMYFHMPTLVTYFLSVNEAVQQLCCCHCWYEPLLAMWQIQWMLETTLILNDVKIRRLAPAETGQCSGRQNTNNNCRTKCNNVYAMKFLVILHPPLICTSAKFTVNLHPPMTLMLIYSKYKAAVDRGYYIDFLYFLK